MAAGGSPAPTGREEGLARRLLEERKGDWELGGGARSEESGHIRKGELRKHAGGGVSHTG